MRNRDMFAIAAILLVSLTSAPVVAQEVNIMGINVSGPGSGSGRGWKLQPQRGPDGQNVYSADCGADFSRLSRHRVARAASRTWMVGR
jgi:hypothetical protein